MEHAETDWLRADRSRERVGRGMEVHAVIGSTNDRARELLGTPGGDGRAVVAEEQTAGRGRRGRAWISPPGHNLMVSVALRPRLPAVDAWQLGAAAALAARAACAPIIPIGLKWPNDLVADDGAKLGGLLVETSISGERIASAVIGIGINVNWRRAEMPEVIAAGATSLADVADVAVDRAHLLGRLLDELDAEILTLEAGRSPLLRYRAACVTVGTDVIVEHAGVRTKGHAADIDEHGALVVETDAGPVVLSTGEVVRVRGAALTVSPPPAV